MEDPGIYNIFIQKAKLYDKTFTWTINGTPVDLTGYSAQINFINAASTTVLTLSTTLDINGNGIVLGGEAGTVELIMKTAMNSNLPFRKARYTLGLTRPDGENIPFLAGSATVEAGTTE